MSVRYPNREIGLSEKCREDKKLARALLEPIISSGGEFDFIGNDSVNDNVYEVLSILRNASIWDTQGMYTDYEFAEIFINRVSGKTVTGTCRTSLNFMFSLFYNRPDKSLGGFLLALQKAGILSGFPVFPVAEYPLGCVFALAGDIRRAFPQIDPCIIRDICQMFITETKWGNVILSMENDMTIF